MDRQLGQAMILPILMSPPFSSPYNRGSGEQGTRKHTPDSRIMVVPPARAALVPWQKSSAGVMPRTGICSRVWTSMPPGRTNSP